jgi:hypothetical protein
MYIGAHNPKPPFMSAVPAIEFYVIRVYTP